MDNTDSFGSRRNFDVVSAVTEIKNIASFGAVTETETEFRSVFIVT